MLSNVLFNSSVMNPTHISKPQREGKVSTFKPQETIKIWYIIIKVGSCLFYAKLFMVLVLRVGSSFLLDPTLHTSPKPHLQKNVAMWVSLSYLGLRTWDPTCTVVSPNCHALNGGDYTDWPQVTWDLGTLLKSSPKLVPLMPMCWESGLACCSTKLSRLVPSLTSPPKVLPCEYSCHTWDLGLGTPTCEMVSPNCHALNG